MTRRKTREAATLKSVVQAADPKGTEDAEGAAARGGSIGTCKRAHELKCRWRAAGGVMVIDRKEERWRGVDDGRGGREV